jgi:hypothetical protein
MSLKNAPLNPEWSYPVAVEDIPSTGLRLTLAPKAEEKEAIAERLGILTLGALSADLELSREKGGACNPRCRQVYGGYYAGVRRIFGACNVPHR